MKPFNRPTDLATAWTEQLPIKKPSMSTSTPGAFQALQAAESGLLNLKKEDLLRIQRLAQSACDTHQTFNAREFKTFCSNDYLGLAHHPELVKATQDALGHLGLGSGASHLISGHHQAHQNLAERLSGFQKAHIPHAKTFIYSSGYMANLGAITALCALPQASFAEPHALTSIYSAKLNHASIIDGIRLASKQCTVKLTVFEIDHLDALRVQLQGDSAKHKLIICDGVFSMDGNLSPVAELLDLAHRFDALLLIDDAHGFGVLGAQGHGILEHLNLHSERLVYMGTLSKAAGVMGAFVCAHETLSQWIFQKSRPYIYTTASPPALSVATLKSLDLIEGLEGQHKRAHLNHLIHVWRDTLKLKHWHMLKSVTPIQAVLVGDNRLCVRLDQELQAMGYLIPAIRPPTVPKLGARLRITFSANHALEDVQTLAQVLMDLELRTMSA